ncbi:hypothetical protein CPC08DRAFT_769150 [Agrocybe pediades]|nr:hypothetical protein CPC08DRAFT_769150 [Agrocybe pediades]
MCETCRSRHRIYASTRRAKKKLEKAALASTTSTSVAHPDVSNAQALAHDHDVSEPISGPSGSWFSENLVPGNASSNTQLDPLPTSASNMNWHSSLDPHFFATTSSSALANALTLPEPRPILSETNRNTDEERVAVTTSSSQPQNTDGEPQRMCTVKGCKTTIPASYEYKMCPPCRTRYRTYGQTKRAKWKMEREAFDREMASLRTLEDERRQKEGLEPLARNPEALRQWETSVIDEQIPTPIVSVQLDETGEMIRSQSPMVAAGVYPATVGSIDTRHSVSPYTSFDDALPARMCSVSHCHRVLPGYYRFKRCEQHRLQNRHHSHLKRVRRKANKSIQGGEEDDNDDDSEGQESPSAEDQQVQNSETTTISSSFSLVTQDQPHDQIMYTCASEDCNSLLSPGVSWQTCEQCKQKAEFNTGQPLSHEHGIPGQESGDVPGAMDNSEPSPVPSLDADAEGELESLDGQTGVQEAQQINQEDSPGAAPNSTNDNLSCVNIETSQLLSTAAAKKQQATGADADASKGPTFNSIVRQDRQSTRAIPDQQVAFSKFRVEMSPTEQPPTHSAQTQTVDHFFNGLEPQPTHSTLETFLANNPPSSTNATTANKTPAPPTYHADKASKILSVLTPIPIPIPSPTVPTSAPFVYKPPAKKSASAQPSRSKRKAKTSNQGGLPNEGSSVSAPVPAPPPQASSSKTTSELAKPPGPYGCPPSYPYVPYYLPPYALSPYQYASPPPAPSTSKRTSLKSKGKAQAPPPPSMPNFYPYPYPPPPYGYPLPHSGFPYVPPPMLGLNGSTPMNPLHPYAAHLPPNPPGAFPGYPFYPLPPPPPPVSVLPSSSTPLPSLAPPPAVAPITTTFTPSISPDLPSRSGPMMNGELVFSIYGHAIADANSSHKPGPKKRQKVDDNTPMANQPQTQSQPGLNLRDAPAAAASVPMQPVTHLPPPPKIIDPPTVVPSTLPTTLDAGDAHRPSTAVAVVAANESSSSLPGATPPALRPCTTKTCTRTIPAGVTGPICEKCKVGFKKHQAKMKQKFKLEPRRYIVGKSQMRTDPES